VFFPLGEPVLLLDRAELDPLNVLAIEGVYLKLRPDRILDIL